MTYLEEDIESVLNTLTVYPLSVPDDDSASYPCVVYQKVSNKQFRTLNQGNTIARYRFKFSCWGKDYESSLATAKTVKEKLDLNNTDFKLATKENEFDTKETEVGLYRTTLEFFILSDK